MPTPPLPPDPAPPPARADRLRTLGAETFDLLVVGGGITGAGVARDAALRGMRVALIEKDDFASGTSSRSSRLVHGGVRYLEHGHLHLVFEASAERRRLLRLAPGLVRPLAFTWPVYAGARVPRWKLGAGLALYDALAMFRNVATHRQLSKARVLAAEPGLRAEGLRGGATYYDAATDDARLTLANALDASAAGAAVVNHVELLRLTATQAGAVAQVRDTLTGAEFEVGARIVVNATGPWSDETRRRAGDVEAGESLVRGSKGVHVAVPRERIGNQHALTLLSPRDGRVMFVLPAGTHAIIGTTDTYTSSPPDEVRASQRDVEYLLASVNDFFPGARLGPDDVVAAWAGIRPLISARGRRPTAVSREHSIVREGPVITITGGKLTTYRITAQQAVDLALAAIGRTPGATPTAVRPLAGGERPQHGGDAGERVVAGLPYTMGELRWSARHEMPETLADLLVRRTKVAFETRDHGLSVAPAVAAAVAPVLGWSVAQQADAVTAYASDVSRVFGIDP